MTYFAPSKETYMYAVWFLCTIVSKPIVRLTLWNNEHYLFSFLLFHSADCALLLFRPISALQPPLCQTVVISSRMISSEMTFPDQTCGIRTPEWARIVCISTSGSHIPKNGGQLCRSWSGSMEVDSSVGLQHWKYTMERYWLPSTTWWLCRLGIEPGSSGSSASIIRMPPVMSDYSTR